IDDAALVRVKVLDRVLDRHDVLAGLGVDLVDDRSERRALAGPGRSSDENQAARARRKGGDRRGEAELVAGEDLERNRPERARDGATLHENVGAKAREILHAEREVELLGLLELDLLLFSEH